ncbi:MAG TPA: hypothetical protein PKC59_10455 [Burkholderiaceae bacterium]|nr:hypothetical protein [Burkholderiaceae bacterium]HMX11296.1 hypothetical protein [Burkholderiaceae bacterium]HMZ01090.1 hypothetical protein [Burkholderiaceae bacterium]HNB46255.1 hypothetical protein [Burkholderiaceae bacterium]HNG81440.1 hypothetical protein [Burkholderiaceae bacterium]
MSARLTPDAIAPALDRGEPQAIGSAHRRRLREVWRSAGWPCQDVIEAELLAAGLLERQHDAQQRMTLRVSDRGLQVLAQTAEHNRATRSAHDRLVAAVAATLARDGRIAWCGLSLRARVGDSGQERWQMARPDVYSVRHTSVAAYLQPVVHEIKVRRADLLADLRRPSKRQAYLQMAGALYYVLAEGIADADEVPTECGVLLARLGSDAGSAEGPDNRAAASLDPNDVPPARLEVLRPAPTRALEQEAGLPFAVWMALARASPANQPGDPQLWLGA